MRAQLILVASAFTVGCSTAPDRTEFVIRVDSVQSPGAVSGGAPFTVKVFGYVGSNLCYRFKEFRVARTPGAADVTVVGWTPEGTDNCYQLVAHLGGEPLVISPPVTDPFDLRIHQPDGAVLTRTIRAE